MKKLVSKFGGVINPFGRADVQEVMAVLKEKKLETRGLCLYNYNHLLTQSAAMTRLLVPFSKKHDALCIPLYAPEGLHIAAKLEADTSDKTYLTARFTEEGEVRMEVKCGYKDIYLVQARGVDENGMPVAIWVGSDCPIDHLEKALRHVSPLNYPKLAANDWDNIQRIKRLY